MFSDVRRLFGTIKVTQTDKNIIVEGVPTEVMQNDISKIWNTSKITSNMFSNINRSSFSFPLFFATDIVYALNVMIEHHSTKTNIRVLNAIKEKLYENTWLFDTQSEVVGRLDLNKISEMVFTPLSFQMDFFNYYNTALDKYNLKGALLAGVPGSGKTFCSLTVAQCLNADRVIVVAPKNAINRVWESSIIGLFKEKQTYWLAQDNKPYNNERFIVTHYEALAKTKAILPAVGNKKIVIILDESHNLNEIDRNRTKEFIEICKITRSNNIILASGTPIKALGSEAIPLFRAIDPFFTEDAESRFRKIYGKDASKGLDILKNRLGIVSFKIEKKELNLAPPIIENISIKMPNASDYTLSAISADMKKYTAGRIAYFNDRKKEDEEYFYSKLKEHKNTIKTQEGMVDFYKYEDFLKRIIKAYKIGDLFNVKEELMYCNSYETKYIIPSLASEDKLKFKEIKTVIKYLNLKIQGECLGRVLGRKRIQCHVDMIPFIDFEGICNSTLKKTVVFTSFVEALEECQKYLKNKGLSPLAVYGKTNNELADTVKRFENDINLNPLIATYNSLSTAVPLVMSDTMIMLNAPFRSYIQEQAIARIHRLGADTQTYVYMLSLDTGKESNISTRSIDILQWSAEQVSLITGVESPFEVTESLENMSVTIAAEAYGIEETITIRDVIKDNTPSWSKW